MNKKIKVCIVINDFLVGGAQKLIADMLLVSTAQDVEYEVITLFEFKDKKDFFEIIPNGISVHRLRWRGIKDISGWLSLIKLLRKMKPEVVVSHLFFSNTVTRIIKPFIGYKIITVEHNTYVNKTFTEKLLDRLLSFITFKIVAVSKTVAEFTSKQEHIPIEKFEVIYNGINLPSVQKNYTEEQKDTLLQSLSIQKGNHILLNVGRLTAQKNHSLLIKAFAEFAKTHHNYILIILGEGAQRQELEKQIVSLSIEGKVFLLGARTDILLFYSIADFLISTSFIEGLSIAYLEAMAAGLPLVATKTAGTDEIIKDKINGLFIKDTTENEAVCALETVLNLDLLTLKREALKSAEQFDIKVTTKKYETLYRSAKQKA